MATICIGIVCILRGILFGFTGISGILPVGIVYAIWSGVGIVLTALIGWVAFDQKPDIPALIGMMMIVAGVVVINVFSQLEH